MLCVRVETHVDIYIQVIGKPATAADASDFITAEVLAPCLKEAKDKGWTGGAMLWQVRLA